MSSFGFSGTNAHLVIEDHVDPPIAAARNAPSRPAPVVLSARDEDRLRVAARNLPAFVEASADAPQPTLEDVAYTLQIGREAMQERVAFVASSRAELCASLRRFLDGAVPRPASFAAGSRRTRGALALFEADAGDPRQDRRTGAVGDYSTLLGLWVTD